MLVVFLGLDIGGTHCRSEWEPAGLIPGGDGQGMQPAVHGQHATVTALQQTLEQAFAMQTPLATVCALAGVGDRASSDSLRSALAARGLQGRIAIVADLLAATAAALPDGPGVLLWAGTGSFAVARSVTGELVRVGGRGYLLGDAGSGYDLVRRAAQAVLAAVDGMGPSTLLTGRLGAVFDARPARLGATLQRLDSATVAAQSPVVFAVAAAGDAVARDVVQQSAAALAQQALAAARHAGLEADIDLAVGGGVLAGNASYAACVSELLAAQGFRAPRLLDGRAAARGAARLARAWHEGAQPLCGWVEHVAL